MRCERDSFRWWTTIMGGVEHRVPLRRNAAEPARFDIGAAALQTPRAMGQNRVVAVLIVAALALAGCSGTRARLPGWLGGDTAPAGEPFYAGSDDLAVYAEPSGSARIVGRLPLHARVTRTEIAHGYAHVVADGLEGWVDNARLIWRLPAAGTARPAPATETPTDDVPAPTSAPPTDAAPPPSTVAPPPVDPPPAAVPDPAPPPTPTVTPSTVPRPRAPTTYDPF